MAWLSGYTTRIKLTIDHTKVDANLTDLPCLVKLTAGRHDFSHGNADGFDTRFTASDGETLLKYERERHDGGSSLAEYWVKIPAVASGTDTEFYFYFRVADTADGADPTNVWDANYKTVHHLSDLTTSTTNDSTSNNNDGTKYGANEPVETATAQIYESQDFDGSDDYMYISDIPAMGTACTVSGWIRLDDKTADHAIAGDLPAEFQLWFDENGASDRFGVGIYVAGWQVRYGTTNPDVSTWYHVAFTDNGTTTKLYVNGAQEGADLAASISNQPNEIYLGAVSTTSKLHEGQLDEVRFCDDARTAAEIKADCESGKDTLLTYAGEETSGEAKETSDSVTLTDAATMIGALGESDALTLTDAATMIAVLQATDSLVLSDTAAMAGELGESDSLTLADQGFMDAALQAADDISLSDEATLAVALALVDSLGLSDLVVTLAVPLVTDSLSIAEVLELASALSISDELALSELPLVGLGLSVVDSFSLAELVGRAVGLQVADQLTLVGAIVAAAQISTAEAISIDSRILLVTPTRALMIDLVRTRSKLRISTEEKGKYEMALETRGKFTIALTARELTVR